MAYFWFKTFHLIGIVVWFAGLFYLVRLFVYHVEATEQPEPARTILQQQYQIMEKRLYHIITTPGLVLTAVMAIALILTEPQVLQETWLHVKLGCVGLLIAYHFYCGWILKKLARQEYLFNSKQFRALNEFPTIFLMMIVLLAVFKNSLPLTATLLVLGGIIIAMILFFQIYAIKRQQQKLQA